MTSLSSDIVCDKCESPLDSRRIKLGLKDCIECSDTKAYRVHQVYPHKTGGYVQPISDQQADHLNKLDRRSTGGGKTAKGIIADNSWDRWLERYYDNIYNKPKRKKYTQKISKIFSHLNNKSLYQRVIKEFLTYGYYRAQDKINELYSQDKISLTQKSKMMTNLSSFQMLTKKEKRFFKLDTKEL